MLTIQTSEAMQAWAQAARRSGIRVGLVPTMGALHEGHLSLIRRAFERVDHVVVSIFVNPTQFAPGEDLDRYPRQLAVDAERCAAEGVTCLFAPEATGVYAADHSVYVEESVLSKGLCGGTRPEHFRGVLTVVAKLFNLVQPDVAVFGQKDAQQAALIRRMVRDLDFPVEIDVAPIVREPDGLAMSSRNAYLSVAERQSALGLSRSLQEAVRAFGSGVRDATSLRAAIAAALEASPDVRIDYVATVDAESLAPVETLRSGILIALAAYVGRTRLIDNVVL